MARSDREHLVDHSRLLRCVQHRRIAPRRIHMHDRHRHRTGTQLQSIGTRGTVRAVLPSSSIEVAM